MKKSIILFSLLMSMFVALFPTTASAEQSANRYAIYTYRNDGDFNAFLIIDVDSITYSKIDLDGQVHRDIVVQEVWTPDSLYRIPMASIDSIAFRAPDPVLKPDLFHITDSHVPYLQDVSYSNLAMSFDSSIPASMLPVVGQVVVTDVYDEPLDRGFAGRVTGISTAGGIVTVNCEEVTLEDVYDQLVYVGKSVSYSEGDSPSGAPRRIRIDEDGTLEFPLDKWTYTIADGDVGSVALNAQPSVTMDYTICYNVKGQADRFKCILHNKLECSLDMDLQKSGEKSFEKDFAKIRIPTGVWFLSARLHVGGFLDLAGSVEMNAHQSVTLQNNIGYDSQLASNNGFVFNFEGSRVDMPTGEINLNASVHAGLSLKLVAFVIFEELASANVRLKAGPRLSGKINYSTTLDKPLSWYALKDSYLKIEPLVASLSAGVNTLFSDEISWNLGESSLLGDMTYYLFPEFTAPALPALDAAGYSLTALTTNMTKNKRNLIFPVTPGIKITKNNQDFTYFSTSAYQEYSNWDNKNLQMELLNNYSEGTYTATPVFKIANNTIDATPTSSVKIPQPLTLDRTDVSLAKDSTQYILMSGGWGNYTITNNSESCCTAAFVTPDGNYSSSTWPPASTHPNAFAGVVPRIRITGCNNGTAKLTIRDVRSHRERIANVIVSVDGSAPMIALNKTDLDCGTVEKGEKKSESFKVTGLNVTGNLTLSSNNSYFKLNVTSISKTDAAKGVIVTVTYDPSSAGDHTGTITISGGGASSKTVNVSGKCVSLTATPETLEIGPVTVGGSGTGTITLKGENLSEDIILITPYIESIGGEFTVNKTAVPATGGTIIVTYKPAGTGTSSAELKFKSGNLIKRVIVNGTAIYPKITLDKTTLNMGTVEKGSKSTGTFKVTGNELTSNVSLSCDNPNFKLSVTSISIADAAAGKTVTVTYEPSSAGNHTGTITISSNGSGTKTVSVSGKCVSLTATPETLEIGPVTVGGSGTGTITLKGENLSEDITLITPYIESIGGEFTVNKTAVPATGGTIIVTYKPAGTGTSSAELKFKSGNLIKRVIVNGTAIYPKITLDKTTLNMGTVEKGSKSTGTFKVTGNELTSNVSLSCDNPNFKLSVTSISIADAAAGKTVTVTYEPSSAGNHTGTITISSNGSGTKTVSVSGKCVSLTATPETLEIGPVTVGGSGTGTITLKGENLSEDIILITPYIESIGGEFTVNKTAVPATGGTIIVTYKPAGTGTSNAEFKFKSGNLIKRVIVNGTAIYPKITLDKTTLNMGTVEKGNSSTGTFKVTGTDLTGNLTLSSSNSNFKLSVTSISKADAAAGKTVTVTYSPTAAGNHNGTITISGGGAASKTVNVSGKCVSLTATPETLEIGPVTVGGSGTGTITLKGENLSEDIILITPYIESIGGEFTVNKTAVPATGGTIIVTYKPAGTGTSNAEFKFKSGNLIKRVIVNGTAVVPTPSVEVNPSSLHFDAADSQSFYLKGHNLSSDLSLTVLGTGKSYFSVKTSTVTKSNATSGTYVLVTCSPTAKLQTATAYINIAHNGTVLKTVSLSYAKNQPLQINSVDVDVDDDDAELYGMNVGSQADPVEVNELLMGTKVYPEGQNIIIETPVGQSAFISDISGRTWSVELSAGRNEIPVNASGIYIVRIREKIVKLMLR